MSPASRQRVARFLRILVPVTVLGVILVAVGTVGFVQFSSTPSFCKSCHIMKPYYDSWAQSSHRTVACIKCHIAPGIRAEAMTKVQAANMVVKDLTGATGTRPWAEVEDASCLRSGCHSQRLIEGVVEYKGVRFDHTQHLGEIRRGIQLRCTSCHSQIVQGSHIAVTETTCFLCHFKGREEGNPVGGCTGCHALPPRVTSPEGMVVDHPQIVKDRVDCLSCHSQVTHGAGTVDPPRCVSCHNEPARLSQISNPALLHSVHVAEHNIACIQCHSAIEHKITALTTMVQLDCKSCHKDVHLAQQRMFAGVGGHDAAPEPSAMFLARVTCLACHGEAQRLKGHDSVQVAGEASCLSCHGVRYANVLPGWQSEMTRKGERVQAVVAQARAAVGATPMDGRALADSLVGLAQQNVDFVRIGKGAHNVAYADRLLRGSLTLVQDAVRRAKLPYTMPALDLGRPISENACLQCHLGVERRTKPFRGVAFDHEPHVLRAGMDCMQCHTPLDRHGGTKLTSAADCNSCHHPVIQPGNCARCHAGAGGAPARTISLPKGNFSHRAHQAANLACIACHTAPVMSARDLTCDNCHVEHHQPQANCLDCHRGGALAKHKRADHVACVQCHASVPRVNQWTRQVCTSCHATMTAHYTGRACEACHQLPTMGAARAGTPPRRQ
jgi:nitrate/TMAO reductase-like tetraheme cytochrome c subunit